MFLDKLIHDINNFIIVVVSIWNLCDADDDEVYKNNVL